MERGPLLVEAKWRVWRLRGWAENGKLCPECGTRHVLKFRLCSRVPPGPGVFTVCQGCGWRGRLGDLKRTLVQRVVWSVLGRMRIPDFSSLPGLRGFSFAAREVPQRTIPVGPVDVQPMPMPTMSDALRGIKGDPYDPVLISDYAEFVRRFGAPEGSRPRLVEDEGEEG